MVASAVELVLIVILLHSNRKQIPLVKIAAIKEETIVPIIQQTVAMPRVDSVGI